MDEFYEADESAVGTADPDAAVAHALDQLTGLDELPPADHVARFEAVHDVLQSHLSGDA